MGLLDRMRDAKAARAAEAERKQAEVALAQRRKVESELVDRLEEARTMEGETSGLALNLKKGEAAFLVIEGSALIEPRRVPGNWQGRSSGYSFRIAKGVSYRIGTNRGSYVQGEEKPQPIDVGTLTVTNHRVVFQGTKASREWQFSKLLGTQHVDLPGETAWTALQVSNRQKVSGFLYTDDVAPIIEFRLALALAHHNGDVKALIEQLEAELVSIREPNRSGN